PRLARRAAAARHDLPAILADERGAVRASEALVLTGSSAGIPQAGDWLLREGLAADVGPSLLAHVAAFHAAHPLEEGATLVSARRALADALRPALGSPHPDLLDAVIDGLVADGSLRRTSTGVAIASYRPADRERDPLVQRLVDEIGADPALPPTIKELVSAGIGRDAIDAATRAGLVVRVAPDLLFTPALVERATSIVVEAGARGITVSAFREALGTSRKYAVPLLEWFDQRGVTRREGDLRFPRSP
ncbi:MAG: SelB C-terminal domain-containing protein, partial [Actinomycetota bacterium]